MKSKIIIFIFLLTVFKVSGQAYRPLPLDSMTTWRIYFQGQDGLSGCTCSSYYLYKTDGDTLIGAYNYTKIKRFGNPGCLCNSALTTMGVIRQDSIARKVYLIETDSTTEKILYDFTQTVGDTVNSVLWPGQPTCPHSIISAVDSILINGQYHRQLHIQPNGCTMMNVRFIEGIGSTEGLFEKLIYWAEIFPNLECLSHNGTALYPNSSFACETTLQVEDIGIKNSFQTFLFPNPSANSREITLKTNITGEDIEIFDSKMVLVFKQKLNSLDEIVLDLKNLNGGLYFIIVTGENGNQTLNKLIVE